MATALFLLLLLIVLIAAVAALGGRWAPDGLPAADPALAAPSEMGVEPAFDVVLRGYRMSQVDAHIAGLRERIADLEAQGDPPQCAAPPWAAQSDGGRTHGDRTTGTRDA